MSLTRIESGTLCISHRSPRWRWMPAGHCCLPRRGHEPVRNTSRHHAAWPTATVSGVYERWINPANYSHAIRRPSRRARSAGLHASTRVRCVVRDDIEQQTARSKNYAVIDANHVSDFGSYQQSTTQRTGNDANQSTAEGHPGSPVPQSEDGQPLHPARRSESAEREEEHSQHTRTPQ